VVPYTREEVEKSLAEVCPYDWHTFFETRIYEVNNKPPTDGIEAAGWRLIYNDVPNNESPYPGGSHGYDAWYSIGLSMGKDSTVDDVLPGSPAYEAGLGPHMSILAVDGRPYSSDALNEAIAHPKDGRITLVVRNFDTVESLDVQYAGGVRRPHLDRIEGTHDYLSDILASQK
jgi:predicted metalloprotease with PDZ domain